MQELLTLAVGLACLATLLADSGYYGEANVDACCAAEIVRNNQSFPG
jgi:hypothetical protein